MPGEGPVREERPVLTVYGARGSHPVCGAEYLEFGGHTTCYAVRARGQVVIFDAGTGIIGLGDALAREHTDTGAPVVSTLLISHTHHDHTQGFPFFKPLHLPGSRLHLFGPRTEYVEVEDALAQGMTAPFFPVSLGETKSVKTIRSVRDGATICFFDQPQTPRVCSPEECAAARPRMLVRVRQGDRHPKAGVLYFRLECDGASVVYATDTEGMDGGDPNLVAFARGASLLIHDAQYLPEEYTRSGGAKRGFGHSTYQMACEVARAAGVGRLLLHHHDPDRSDAQVCRIEAAARELFAPTDAAREGATYRL